MNTFDPSNPEQTSNRERPAPDDPEAPFYQSQGRHNPGQHPSPGYSGFGYPPDMDPDGFAHQQSGWRGRPGWQPWAGGGYSYRRQRRFGFWPVLLVIVLLALFIPPFSHFLFGLVGLGFLVLLILLPFAILRMLLRHRYGWRRQRWHRWNQWGGPWGW